MVRVYFVHSPSQQARDGWMCENLKAARLQATTMLQESSVMLTEPEVIISELRISFPSRFIINLLKEADSASPSKKTMNTFRKFRVTGKACGKCLGCNTVTGQLPLFESMLINRETCSNRTITFHKR